MSIEYWVDTLREYGLSEGQEQFDICIYALSNLGKPYGQSEEFSSSVIDCSMLTSQSHWIGAQIGIPFTADVQRIATNGERIDELRLAEPGDIMVAYSDVRNSPDKQHNHVGLFLGPDRQGEPSLIEARGDVGVVISKVRDFPLHGGIRRFWRRREAVPYTTALLARHMATNVPRLGRLGAKQYLKRGGRCEHRGVDIYAQPNTPILSPICGELSFAADAILIQNKTWKIEMRGAIRCHKGGIIQAGTMIALLSPEPHDLDVSHSDLALGPSHLEVRVMGHDVDVQSIQLNGQRWYNYLHGMRIGRFAAAM